MLGLINRKMNLLAVIGLLTLIVSVCNPPKPVSYNVPAAMWAVSLVPAPHTGEPSLLVTISNDFSWPQPAGEPSQPVHYRITLTRPNEDPIENVGQLTADERFSVILLSPRLETELAVNPEDDRRRIEELKAQRDGALEALGGSGQAVPDDIVERVESILQTYSHGIDTRIDERAAVMQYEIELIPFAGDRGLPRQEGDKKKADPPKYKWGTAVTDDKDPCKGKTPEACALEKLQKIKERICNARKPDNTPRFPKECELLTAMLDKKPPEPKIECIIPADKGVTAGVTHPLTGAITLNGEDFLTNACADATVMHELSHAIEMLDPEKYKNLKKFREAEERVKKAAEDIEKAKNANDKAGLKKARDDFAKAIQDVNDTEQEAGKELLQSECNALFITLDNADFFGYPGDGKAWMKENIKGMVGELSGIRKSFNLEPGSPAVKGPLCDCFKKIRDWVNNHPDIKDNFDKEIFKKGPPDVTWTMAISALADYYCK